MSFFYLYYSAFLVLFYLFVECNDIVRKLFEFLTTYFYLIKIFNLSATGMIGPHLICITTYPKNTWWVEG
jgi:hypothetical protein